MWRFSSNMTKKIHSVAHIIIFLVAICGLAAKSYGQNERVEFIRDHNRKHGFDSGIIDGDSSYVGKASLSLISNKNGKVRMNWSRVSYENRFKLDIQFGDIHLRFNDSIQNQRDTIDLWLPPCDTNYTLIATLHDKCIGELHVEVMETMHENVIIVPLVKTKFDRDSLERYINQIYHQAGVDFFIDVDQEITLEGFEFDKLNNPSSKHDRYTRQLIEIRNAYFNAYPSATKGVYYLFVIDGFVNDNIDGYMARNKAFGFIKPPEKIGYRSVVRTLSYGTGGLISDTIHSDSLMNLMCVGDGTNLNKEQWELIRHNIHSISFYDDYEDVQTRGGLVAFYFWEEDSNGDVILDNNNFLSAIQRPIKRNQYSYHLNITNVLFKPLFILWKYRINTLHLLAFIALVILSFLVRRPYKRWISRFKRFKRFMIRFGMLIVFVALLYESFVLINMGYGMYVIKRGEIPDYSGLSMREAKNALYSNHENPKLAEDKLGSQLMIKRGDTWTLEQHKRILYFNCRELNGEKRIQYSHDSDTLKIETRDYEQVLDGHYFVMTTRNKAGKIIKQQVFNHSGTDITSKLDLPDPAKRILLFVNGYRATSTGQSLEQNFNDILNKGLEFPNSKNLIYDFDRYDYWRPWKEIDVLFANRVNPDDIYYADGHYSVETSNHRSLLNFTSLSSAYPDRCVDQNNHTCKEYEVSGLLRNRKKNTVDLFDLRPNKRGFKERKEGGRIAGRNLAQMLDEIPNRNENDTLFIVAHSMGFAYSLGIIEEVRGKINFGDFYIIAPENPKSGEVYSREWQNVWHYGSDFESNKKFAPCLTDGIAPQAAIPGLNSMQRIFIPEKLYNKQGFYASHFIGYYTWIFDIDEGQPGYIRQH